VPGSGSVEVVALLLLVEGVLLRSWIYVASPLPSDTPLAWFALGTAQDVAILAITGALALVAARWARRLAMALFAVVCILLGVVDFVWAQVVAYFAHAPSREDLSTAVELVVFIRSIDIAMISRVLLGASAVGALLIVVVRRYRGRAWWVTRARLVCVGAGALIVALAPLRVHLASSAANPAVAVARLLLERGSLPPIQPVSQPASPQDTTVRSLAPRVPPLEFTDSDFPLAHRPPPRSAGALTLPTGLKPNVVIILMEGVRAHEIGAYQGFPPGVTPSLDQLAAKGIVCLDAMSPGTRTPEGELGVWYGLLAIPDRILITSNPNVPLTGLPEILRRAGWRSFLWMHNGDLTFYHRDRFFDVRGFTTIDGRQFDQTDPFTNWGFSDRSLFRRALVALDHLKPPFAVELLTVSNHHPFQLPGDALGRYGMPEGLRLVVPPDIKTLRGRMTLAMLQTMHYTDAAVGEFIREARRHTWFGSTVFVIASDHGLPITPLDGLPTAHSFAILRHGVPLIFYSALLPGGRVIPGPASVVDVFPTLTGLFGLGAVTPAIGRDLLDPAAFDPDRAVISWDSEARRVTLRTARRCYEAEVARQGGYAELSDELLVDPAADPRGLVNLAEREPALVWSFRRTAKIFLDVYPNEVLSGRAVLPPMGGPDRPQ
jgi:arylsulfatase A-like enzyme